MVFLENFKFKIESFDWICIGNFDNTNLLQVTLVYPENVRFYAQRPLKSSVSVGALALIQ